MFEDCACRHTNEITTKIALLPDTSALLTLTLGTPTTSVKDPFCASDRLDRVR